MVLLFDNYRIRSYQYGYKLSKRKGRQWGVVSYHSTLSQAINELFDLRVKVDTQDFVVDFEDATKFEAQKNALINRIEQIKNELMAGEEVKYVQEK